MMISLVVVAVGGVVVATCVTITLKVVVAVLEALSIAVQSTVVVPTAKFVPEAGSQITNTAPSRLSVAFGSVKFTVVPELEVVVAVTSVVEANTGLVLSWVIATVVVALTSTPSEAVTSRLFTALGLRSTNTLQAPLKSVVVDAEPLPPVTVMVALEVAVPSSVIGVELEVKGAVVTTGASMAKATCPSPKEMTSASVRTVADAFHFLMLLMVIIFKIN